MILGSFFFIIFHGLNVSSDILCVFKNSKLILTPGDKLCSSCKVRSTFLSGQGSNFFNLLENITENRNVLIGSLINS